MKEQQLLDAVREAYQRVLGAKLTGIYLHGSLAFGCYRRECSDIDFLAVVESALTMAEKEALIRSLLALDWYAPPKGFEMSVVCRDVCSPFVYPTPYELHYSNAFRENYQKDLVGTCRALQGTDPDLAAHITVICHAGVTLCGVPADEVFAKVPHECYLDSILQDIRDAEDGSGRDPVYYLLNLCRVLAYVKDGLVLSKEQGGEWGRERLPQERAWVEHALAIYRGSTSEPFPPGTVECARRLLGRIRASANF